MLNEKRIRKESINANRTFCTFYLKYYFVEIFHKNKIFKINFLIIANIENESKSIFYNSARVK